MSNQEAIDDLDESAEESKAELTCPTCGKVAKTSAGLAGHMRLAHQKPTKLDGYAKFSTEAFEKQQQALEEALEEALAKNDESTKKYVGTVLKELERDWEALFHGRLEALETQVRNANFSELNKKLEIIGRLIESVGNGVVMTSSAKWCEDDIKGLRALGVEPKPYTMEHVKR